MATSTFTLPSWVNPHINGLRCVACAATHDPLALAGVCTRCGESLAVEYELGRKPPLVPEQLFGRQASLWRYREILPIRAEAAVSLVEGWTPLLPAHDRLLVKDETRNPGGAMAARGLAVAVSMARVLGARRLASSDDSAATLAAYAAAARLPALIALPASAPALVEACRRHGAEVHVVADPAAFLGQHEVHDLSAGREPYRVEGDKTLAYELWEQLAGELPELILVPAGSERALTKGFAEMRAMAWPLARTPRVLAVEIGDEAAASAAADRLAARCGLDIGLAGGAAYAAYEQLCASGTITPGQRVVLCNPRVRGVRSPSP